MRKTIISSVFAFSMLLGGSYSADAQSKVKSAVDEKDFVASLFTYFTGNSVEEEPVRYALSQSG